MKNITFRQLQIFNEVATRLSFARAAAALHLTPPAVTMQVKELESVLEVELLNRRLRKIQITSVGEHFLVYARRLLATLKEAGDAIDRLRSVNGGVLTVGLVSSAKYFVPRLLASFHEEHPGVEVRLVECQNRERMLALLGEGGVDLAVMGSPPKEFALGAEPIAAHPQVFVAPPGHRLSTEAVVSPHQLADYPFIVREAGSGTRTAMEGFFKSHRISPRIASEMSSNETIKQAVMADMGLAFLSLHTLGLELRSGVLELLAVRGTPVMRGWHLAHPRRRLLSPAAEAFRYFMVERAERFLRQQNEELLDRKFKASTGASHQTSRLRLGSPA